VLPSSLHFYLLLSYERRNSGGCDPVRVPFYAVEICIYIILKKTGAQVQQPCQASRDAARTVRGVGQLLHAVLQGAWLRGAARDQLGRPRLDRGWRLQEAL